MPTDDDVRCLQKSGTSTKRGFAPRNTAVVKAHSGWGMETLHRDSVPGTVKMST